MHVELNQIQNTMLWLSEYIWWFSTTEF